MLGLNSRRGHLRLTDLQQGARRRLIVAVASAFVMLLCGVLLVAMLKPPDEGASHTMTPSREVEEPDEAAPVASAVEPEEAAPPTAVGDPEPEAADKAEVAEKGDDPPVDDPDTGDDEGEPDAVPAAEGGEDDGWWEDIHGKTCTIEFGDHARLIMREGRLAKDQTTTYGPFVNQPIKARVRESLNPSVTVHHLGLHPRNQRPSLAYVTLHQNGMDISGILPLQISGDQIKLVPSKGRRK